MSRVFFGALHTGGSVKPDEDEKQDFIDRTIAKRVQAGLPNSHIGVPALGRVIRIAHHLQDIGQKRYAKLGLTIMRHDILLNLLIEGEPFQLSPTALAEATFMTSGGMSNALERLERDGLLARLPDPNDRRGVVVTLTPKGHDFIAEVQPQIVNMQREVVQEIDEAEMKILNDILRKLLVSIEEQVTES